MVSVRRTNEDSAGSLQIDPERFDSLTIEEGTALLDRQARKYLGMSGDDFRRAYRAGAIEDPNRSEVIRVAMLLPFAEDEGHGETGHP